MTSPLPYVRPFCFAVLFLGSLVLSAHARDPVFLGGYDIPLVDGLVIDEDQLVELDKPEGQISEYTAYGVHNKNQAIRYYREAMPELGWTETKNPLPDQLMFTRGHEQATFIFQTQEEDGTHPGTKHLAITFKITSINKG